MNYQLDGDYLVTSDPGIAVMFLGLEVAYNSYGDKGVLSAIYKAEPFFAVDRSKHGLVKLSEGVSMVGIPRVLVAEAIKPVEGEGVFGWLNMWGDKVTPQYLHADTYSMHPMNPHGGYHYAKANALTIGQTVGQLRRLIEWCNEL